jgi:hypothetical protein
MSRPALACPLVLAATLLASCGGSSAKLIPVADAGPLQSDFETVQQDAETGDGSCATTESALLKTEQDFAVLPASVDAGLRATLRQGIDNLRVRALALCAQPLAQTRTTATTPKNTTSTSTSTTTTPPTTTTSTTPTTPTTPSTTSTTPGGGTPAPGETPPAGGGTPGGGTGEGASSPQGENGDGNGAAPAEAGANAGGNGAGGQEGAK